MNAGDTLTTGLTAASCAGVAGPSLGKLRAMKEVLYGGWKQSSFSSRYGYFGVVICKDIGREERNALPATTVIVGQGSCHCKHTISSL